ncbi:hypothetical protein IJI70_01395 [Candidatus Saccharibacteria bacterium]|nr:hypothetical protein [Candidatus Saccharibacteria bacterium]
MRLRIRLKTLAFAQAKSSSVKLYGSEDRLGGRLSLEVPGVCFPDLGAGCSGGVRSSSEPSKRDGTRGASASAGLGSAAGKLITGRAGEAGFTEDSDSGVGSDRG